MIVERTLNTGLCYDICLNETIWDCISEDGATVDNLKIDVVKDYWLSIYDNDIDIGVVSFIQKYAKTWEVHIHILPEHRRDYSKKAGLLIEKWAKDVLDGCTITTNVPTIYPNVRKFMLQYGFEDIGLLRKAWLKHGQRNDMFVMSREV